MRGIVDSSDLSLNISREILQQDRQVKAIANSLEKKISAELKKMMEDDSAYRDMREKQGKRRENSEKGANAYTVFLSVICLGIAVLFFVYKDLWFGLGFVGLSAILGLVAFFSYRSEYKNRQDKEEKNQDK